MADATLFFNPTCSKCRTAKGILADEGVAADELRYLDRPPTVDELRTLMHQLGITDPRLMMRTSEPAYAELGLAGGDAERLLAAITTHPILLERPIFVKDGKAVIARPPERVRELY